jgi:hypothetical protein
MRPPVVGVAGLLAALAATAAAPRTEPPAPSAPAPQASSFLADIWVGDRAVRRTVEGNLIDLNCYVEHGGFGEGHRRCARTCAQKGMPVGLIDGQGRIYLISSRGHLPPAEINRPLLDLLETTVVVTGEFFENQDVKVAVIHKVAPAARQRSADELRALYKGPAN